MGFCPNGVPPNPPKPPVNPPKPRPGFVPNPPLNPPPIPPNPGVDVLLENIVVLNGFATPCASVIWGRNPTPTPPAPVPVPVVVLRLGPNPFPSPLVLGPVPSPPPSPVVNGCCELRAPNPVGWVVSPEVPNPPIPPRVVDVLTAGPGEDTVDLGGDPSCPWFSLVADGVVGPDPGIGGRLSNNDVPNDDDGLKVFNPVNVPRPVGCEVSPVVG